MSEKSMCGWDKMLRNQYGLHLQDAGHLQQGGDSKVTTALDTGDGALRLPDTRAEVRLR
jgi:hypothetical protein